MPIIKRAFPGRLLQHGRTRSDVTDGGNLDNVPVTMVRDSREEASHKYRARAAECMEAAERSRNEKIRQSLLELGAAFDQLAKYAQRSPADPQYRRDTRQHVA